MWNQKEAIDVLYAGSLVTVMERSVGPSFADSGYIFRGEGHGSVQNSNLVKDGQRYPDVFISAAIEPLRILMENDPPLVTWYITFATDEMAIAYNSKSRFFDQFEEARSGALPWYQVLANPQVKFLRTDPELDPKGYYMVIVAKLADLFYKNSSISNSVLRGERNTDQLRPEETLITLLEIGEADAIPVYKHEAIERGLPFISLPPEINLGSLQFADYYKQDSYKLQSGRMVYGAPITFVVTIPKTVKDMTGAIEFVKFLLSEKGGEILTSHGFSQTSPAAGGNVSDMPRELARVIKLIG
jgi:molybdate/tungstate transport system substrate-binding protein